MIVKKILNNNLLLTIDKNGFEQIVMGKGIRFINNVGEKLKQEHIQKIYVLKNSYVTQNYMHILRNVTPSDAEIIEEALQIAYDAFPKELSEQLFISLFDHLVFAIERHKNHIVIPNRLFWEIKQFYPNEFSVSNKIRKYLNEKLNLALPEEESSNIAFHIVNAKTHDTDMTKTMKAIQVLKDIYRIVQLSFGQSIEKNSIHYSRFLTHMQFFIQRLFENNLLKDNSPIILNPDIDKNSKAYICAQQISIYINKKFNIKIPHEEFLYLTLHINRIMR